MTRLIIVRGLPGSGKSTIGRALAESLNIRHIEADEYFIGHDGVYRFEPSLLSVAHGWCQDLTRHWLEDEQSVVVANTFTTMKEMEPYFDMAHHTGAVVQIIETSLPFTPLVDYPNEHNCPLATVEKMAARWQKVDADAGAQI